MKNRYTILLVAWSLFVLSCFAWSPIAHGSGIDPPLDDDAASIGAASGAQSSTSTSSTRAHMDPGLLKQLIEGTPDDRYHVIVELVEQSDVTAHAGELGRLARRQLVVAELQATARRSQANMLDFLQGREADGRVSGVHPFWIFNGLQLSADADTLLAIADRPEVEMIREDRWRAWLDPALGPQSFDKGGTGTGWNISWIRADLVWQAFGVSGGGTTVAIMDTGVDWQHPALQAQYRGYKPGGLAIHEGNWYCTTDEGYLYPVDGFGHGTHVAGIAVGSTDAAGRRIGIAPGARWIAVKTLNDNGYGYDSWIHAAFEWLMAPAGNPALAPDIVNGSWGGRYGEIETFRADVEALRAAGIVPVFAAGNNGPIESTIGCPASYPEAIAVGASDDLDRATSFSSRGPSPWGEIKPEISAPGIDIYSSLPGGTYGLAQGTSMAAPHVAGLAALLLEADPMLTVDGIESLITSTALPQGEDVPNNDTGWGRIDAYQAVAVALKAGFVTGKVVGLGQAAEVPGAGITVYDELNTRRAVVYSDTVGTFRVALPSGMYLFSVQAFGFEPKLVSDVTVEAGYTTTLDIPLAPLPRGVLSGAIYEVGTENPVSAQANALGTPMSTISDPVTGRYALDLPVGVYTVEVSRNGYRRFSSEPVEIRAGQTTVLDVALLPAPTLLFVDSGWWYYGSKAQYLTQALDVNDYVYDTLQIRDLQVDPPNLEDLAPYQITVWSSPLDAPGLIGAGDTISNYLANGGDLFLTGQDVGFWESGASGITYHEYYRRFLSAELVSDDAGRGNLIGAQSDILHDLVLPINGPDSAQNQASPDMIASVDPHTSALIADYENAGGAGLRASGCQSYRVVYLGAGLEGLGDRSSRTALMDRAMSWLASPAITTGMDLYPARQDQVRFAKSYLTYTVELRNTGKYPEKFSLELSPSSWASSVWDSSFSQTITRSNRLDPCESQILGLMVMIPPDAEWNASDTVTLTVRSLTEPSRAAQATFTSKTPAPILLVDDHRWYDVTPMYRAALGQAYVPYDLWITNPSASTVVVNRPSLQVLQCYPLVIWYTGSDWWSTLVPAEEATLAQYLDSGGRLLLSSQDYLETSGFTPFAQEYLGVAAYTEGLTVTNATGALSNPIGEGLDVTHLHYPFQNRSDALKPTTAAQPAFWGQHDQPAGLTLEQAPWKTAFFAFPVETLPVDKLAEVMRRAVGWLSPLADSDLLVDRSAASGGEKLLYTLSIRNGGLVALARVSLSNTVPLSATYIVGSLEGPADYDAVRRRFTWQGELDAGETIAIRYRLQLDNSILEPSTVRNIAHLSDERGLALDRLAVTRVNAPDLSRSMVSVNRETATPGDVLTYTFTLYNTGPRPAQARLEDPVPLHTIYHPGSAWASSGVITRTEETLVWHGLILPGETVSIRIPLLLSASSAASFVLNCVVLDDGVNGLHRMETYTWVNAKVFVPVVYHWEGERRQAAVSP
jgi:uncharacterized repeat protein (TIGR01451 family)